MLDDVWNEDYNEWDKLKSLLIGDVKGSKILMTMRAKIIAKITCPISTYTVKGYLRDQNWSLFEKITYIEGQETNNPKLVAIGREIVDKCQRVPLALKCIGSVLLFEETKLRWLDVKNNVLENVIQQENDILLILKLSYDHLSHHI